MLSPHEVRLISGVCNERSMSVEQFLDQFFVFYFINLFTIDGSIREFLQFIENFRFFMSIWSEVNICYLFFNEEIRSWSWECIPDQFTPAKNQLEASSIQVC